MWDKIKHYWYRFTLSILTAGASLILGLLSFGGMYAIWPAVIPAIISFFFSTIESEVYTQNLGRTGDKLFTKDYFEEQLSRAFLKEICTTKNIKDIQIFLLFKSYTDALFNSEEVKSKAFKAKFYKLLTATTAPSDPNDLLLYKFLHQKGKNGEPSYHERYLAKHKARLPYLYAIQAFSAISALFMGLGTTYLLVEAFTIIPVLAALPFAIWPIIITPMAVVAGIAYGLLTYNAMTNLMCNDTLNTWYKKLSQRIKDDPWNPKHIGMALTASLLFAMALTLTICTAGTWWTVVRETKPLFQWMTRIPSFVMGVINPIITGFSALVFNIENTSETLEMIENGVEVPSLKDLFHQVVDHLATHENVLQWLNPFRLIIVGIVLPMRYVMFVGHLFSIGVTADRIPGFSAYGSALLGSISEGFEDVHYFMGHNHADNLDALLEQDLGESQGHEHKEDLPTWLIDKLALPIYLLAASWHSLASVFNSEKYRVGPVTAWQSYRHHLTHAESQCEHESTCHNHALHNEPKKPITAKPKFEIAEDKSASVSPDLENQIEDPGHSAHPANS